MTLQEIFAKSLKAGITYSPGQETLQRSMEKATVVVKLRIVVANNSIANLGEEL